MTNIYGKRAIGIYVFFRLILLRQFIMKKILIKEILLKGYLDYFELPFDSAENYLKKILQKLKSKKLKLMNLIYEGSILLKVSLKDNYSH